MCKHYLLLLALALLVGCDSRTAEIEAVLAPYQGDWQFSLSNTIQRWMADGVPQDQIDVIRESADGRHALHPNLRLRRNFAVLPGDGEGSYEFYALHQHAGVLCGKAWHHEDRHDPGDMSKCVVRLELRGAELHLSVRMQVDPPDPSDQEIIHMPLAGGAAESCAVDDLPTSEWSPWETYVFQRATAAGN